MTNTRQARPTCSNDGFRKTRIVALLLSLVFLTSERADAFTTLLRSRHTKISTSSSSLNEVASPQFHSKEDERVVKAGGGVPIVPRGNNNLFDPSLEGKIGNTYDRIVAGHKYVCSHSGDELMTYVGNQQQRQAETMPTQPTTTTTARKDVLPVLLKKPSLVEAQNWLEEGNFFEAGEIPQNFAKPTSPATATVLGRTRLIGKDAPGDIQHIVLQLPEGMHYVEGQSLSVIPPSPDGKKQKPRLYSIASTRYGDLLDGRTVSLCVRRAVYVDPTTGKEDPTKAGVCSNMLCNVQKGDTVQVAGPVGKTMLLPKNLDNDIIMVATGTGIAPFRAFLHRLFVEHTVDRHKFNGQAWLILGVPVTSGLLYPREFQAMQDQNNVPGDNKQKLRIDYAISREMKTPEGKKVYVQDVLAQHADVLLDKLDNGATIYFCGLKGMMPGILESLEKVCIKRGLDFNEKHKQWKQNHQ